ncbi:hypothetical protein [Sphingobacterium bovistauri]|uniref:Lipoprotein n=1 Tax=Sphingobacterium bovistauri TaxID=2781959 RepID=A0ABS7Z6C1_9SPHI|nr:hypothetical protein [Sphingobacterium bovistauri]MCA5004289.1 hypothetical protein [Sphingobacterium bovistauri]
MRTITRTKINSLVFIFCATLLFLGCSKDNNTPETSKEAYFKFKLNGVQKEYKYHINANDPPSEKVIHFVTIAAFESNNIATSTSLGFQLVSDKGAQIGTYLNNNANGDQLHATYAIQNVSNGQITGTTTYNTNETPFTFQITSLTKSGVKGKFSGKLKLSGGSEILDVTEGEFSAPYNY